MIENPRIEALRRRVESDPRSIAFAQLAEEYRRAGNHKLAIEICRDGLTRHPGYLSAQVTLGRALIELGQFAEARAELEAVLNIAPDNLTAIRALAEIHQRHGDEVHQSYHVTPPNASGVAPHAPAATAAPAPDAPPVPALPDWSLDDLPSIDAEPSTAAPPAPVTEIDPALGELEQWLAAIVADRSRPR